jgi:6-phospho-beta-glucosidase
MKVAVIGGGSSYTPELLDGLLERADAIGLDQVRLHDIDPRRLAILKTHRLELK